MTHEQVHPQVVIMPNGMESKLASFEMKSTVVEREAREIADQMVQFTRGDNVLEALQGVKGKESIPSISITDVGGIDLLLSRTEHNLMVGFCRKGGSRWITI